VEYFIDLQKLFFMKNPINYLMSFCFLALFACKDNCDSETSACSLSTFPNAVEWKVGDGGNGHIYEAVLADGDITWEEARKSASLRGDAWYLATITSKEENEFVMSLFNQNPNFFNCCLGQVASGPWIGATSSTISSNDWTWITGEIFDFADWGPSEPFGNGDHISYARFGAKVAWNDIPSGHPNSPRSYILECSGSK
jgi:hypothetical protein